MLSFISLLSHPLKMSQHLPIMSPPETFKRHPKLLFLNMTQENSPLSHPLYNLYIPIPSKVIASIPLSLFLPISPNMTHATLPHVHHPPLSQLSLLLLPRCSRDSLIAQQYPSPYPYPPVVPLDTSPSSHSLISFPRFSFSFSNTHFCPFTYFIMFFFFFLQCSSGTQILSI